MLAAVTALDVALISSIAALTAAVITPVVTWIVTVMRNRHERWLHLYDDRRDAYLAILRIARHNGDVSDEVIRVFEADDPGRVEWPEDLEESATALAQVWLFSSKDVWAKSESYVDARNRFNRRLEAIDYEHASSRRAAVSDLKAIREDLRTATAALRDAVNAEIAAN